MRFRHRARPGRVHAHARTLSAASAFALTFLAAFVPDFSGAGVVGPLAGLGFGIGVGRARADDQSPPDPVSLRAELGAEYDDNVHRTEQIHGAAPATIVSSMLARGVLGWSATGHLAPNQDVFASLLGAAKAFANPDARNENVAVIETALGWRAAVAQKYQLAAAGSYYEAIQAGTPAERELNGEARDFRSLTPVARAGRLLGDGWGLLELAGGYRWFVYKPNHGYDFNGPIVALEYRLQRESADGAADWDLTAGTGAELRHFAGPRLVRSPPGCAPADCTPAIDPSLSAASHVDQFASAHLDLTRTGALLLGAGYALQWNRSNSFSESLYRHIGTVRLAAALPFQLMLAARAELVFVTYPDHVVLATGPTGSASTSIEDENRNQLRLELSRAIRSGLRLVARTSVYLNALGQSAVDYRRQTFTLSLTWTTRD